MYDIFFISKTKVIFFVASFCLGHRSLYKKPKYEYEMVLQNIEMYPDVSLVVLYVSYNFFKK